MWEDYNVDDVLYVLGNPQKRDIDVRISPVQFLRDRELGIRDEKHGIVIKEPFLVFTRATESIPMVTR